MTTLRLLILGLLLLSFGSVQAQADSLDRKKHIVKVNHIFNITRLNYNDSFGSINNSTIVTERQSKRISINSYLSASYAIFLKDSSLFEMELRGITLERVKPDLNADTLESLKRDQFRSSINLRTSINFNLLKPKNRLLTLGLFTNLINTNDKNYELERTINSFTMNIGPVLKFGHFFKNSLYLETQATFDAFRFNWELYTKPSSNISQSSIHFYDYFNRQATARLEKTFELSVSVGYNF